MIHPESPEILQNLSQVASIGPKRQSKPPERLLHDEHNVATSLKADRDEPKSVTDALNGKKSVKWKQALRSYSKSSLTLNEWRFNLSFSQVSLLVFNSWRISVVPYYVATYPPAIHKQH